jgi:acyl-coenzyme A synthetase/AMP-(fatty) acid ligase
VTDKPSGVDLGPGLEWLNVWGDETPSAVAVADSRRELTYRDLIRAILQEASRLQSGMGAKVGVAPLTVHNTVDDLVTIFAHAVAGPDPILVDPLATPAEIARSMSRVPKERQDAGLLTDGARCFIMSSSGSTGLPTVTAQRWSAAGRRAAMYGQKAGYEPEDVILCCTPMHHSWPLRSGVLAGLASGCKIIFAPQPATPSSLRDAISQLSPTVLQAVPVQYRLLVDGGKRVESNRLRLAISSAEALNPSVAREWADITGVLIHEEFGTSETGTICFNVEGVPGSVGRPMPDVELRLRSVTESTRSEATADTGLLSVRGPWGTHVWGRGLDGEELDRHWFEPGDLATIDELGRVVLHGREALQINVAGNKVDPFEVEEALVNVCGMKDAAVLGHLNELGIEEVHAFVVADKPISVPALRVKLSSVLSRYKLPARFVQVQTLTRTSSGKLLRSPLANSSSKEPHTRD